MFERLGWEELKSFAAGNRENVEMEFKEDRFPNDKTCARELHEAIVGMLNSGSSGFVILGVEDGSLSPTGTQRDLETLGFSVNSLIRPPVIIYPYELNAEGQRLLVFPVPEQHGIDFTTSDGRYLVRGPSGNVPMTPSLRRANLIARGIYDYSSVLIESEPATGLIDDVAVTLLRKSLTESTRREPLYLNDKTDVELLEELELVEKRSNEYLLTIAGGLLVGGQRFFRTYLPGAEINFFRFKDERGVEYSLQKTFRGPLIQVLPQVFEAIDATNEVSRILTGSKLKEYKKFPDRAVQEALANAVCHRDYAASDGITVKQYPNALVITNPGGFVSGVTAQTILNTTSRLRNRKLAQVMHRLEFVQRAAQGVKLIFQEMLASGRPTPAYREIRTEEYREVELTLNASVDESFRNLLVAMSRINSEPYDVYELIVLHYLNAHHQVAIEEVERLLNRDTDFATNVLDGLIRKAMLIRIGNEYFLTDPAGDFEKSYPILKKAVERLLSVHDEITKKDISQFVDEKVYRTLMDRLKAEGVVEQVGSRKATRYHSPSRFLIRVPRIDKSE